MDKFSPLQQAEVAGLHRVKEDMGQERTRLATCTEQADMRSRELASLKEEFLKLQKQYQTKTETEKTEEAEELRLDLQDVKEMYKEQIEQLTRMDAEEQ